MSASTAAPADMRTFTEIDGERWLNSLMAGRDDRPAGSYTNRNVRTMIARDTRMQFPVYKVTSQKQPDGGYKQNKEVIRLLTLEVPAGTEAVIYRPYNTLPRGLFIATFFLEDRHVSLKAGPSLQARMLSR